MKNTKSDPVKWAQPKKPASIVTYRPAPHPQQHRLDEARKIPSLWTPGEIVKGK